MCVWLCEYVYIYIYIYVCVYVCACDDDRPQGNRDACVRSCVCVCVFIFREGILATLSYSGVLQPIRFRAKKLGYLKPHPGYLLCISVLYQKRQQALQGRGVYTAGRGDC